jgi:large subunit ribosomal protein L9
MEVILLERVEKLGAVGDLVKVRDGYARNFLIPNKKALRATKENQAYFEERKAQIQQENAEKRAEAEQESKKLDGVFVTLIQQAGEDGRLFGSVRRQDITAAIADVTGEEALDKTVVILSTPIKNVGIYSVTIRLHPEVKVAVKVNVARSKDEAEDAKKEFLNPGSGKKGKRKEAAAEEAPVDLAEVAPEGNA